MIRNASANAMKSHFCVLSGSRLATRSENAKLSSAVPRAESTAVAAAAASIISEPTSV